MGDGTGLPWTGCNADYRCPTCTDRGAVFTRLGGDEWDAADCPTCTRMSNLVITLHEMKAHKLGVGLGPVHVESTESNSYTQFKVAELHRRVRTHKGRKAQA